MPTEPVLLLAVAAVMFYASSRTAAGAMGGTVGRAVGHFFPILALALAATWAGLYPLAINVLFACTVMAVTLVFGVSLLSAPLGAATLGRRTWAMFLPVAVLAWMAGSQSAINHYFAVGLAGMGLLIAWLSSDGGPRITPVSAHQSGRPLLVLLSLIVAGMGAVAVVLATKIVLTMPIPVTQGMLAATVVSPLLVLPILGATSELALTDGSAARPMTAGMIVALLNLCVGLPAITYLRMLREHLKHSMADLAFPLPYGVWRLDTVVLVMIGILLVPIGLGRWLPSRGEGVLLVMIYVVYLYLVSPLKIV